MRRSLFCLFVLALAGACAGGGAPRLAALRVLSDGYPRAFFFRSSEGQAANSRISYDDWEKSFSRLMGIEGKVLDEEVPGRSARNIDFFNRFKKAHPDQLVLLHYNGNARDPRDNSGRFFAGHWIYHNGARVLADVPAQEGETDIPVGDARLFRAGIGRYLDSAEDVGLCALDSAGRPDWHKSEQVALVSVDLKNKTIRVKRGQYGTKPRAFAAGRAYAAAHRSEGPWGRNSHLLWFYNHSTACPRDAKGRTCDDVLMEDLAEKFQPGGPLAAFDGLEFDVLNDRVGGGAPRNIRGVDVDADGKIDNGEIDGVNVYGAGVIEFCRHLRQRLGEERLIMADGWSKGNQRAFGSLNGIEAEGWPALHDYQIDDWSGGLNRQSFWVRNGRAPAFSYVNHKFMETGAKPGDTRQRKLPFNIHRLVFAGAVFADSAICYSLTPPAEPGELIGIWDELWMGTEHRPAWLGRPLGPAVHLAEREGIVAGMSLPVAIKQFPGEGISSVKDGAAIKTAADNPAADRTRFQLLANGGPDLVVKMRARATMLRRGRVQAAPEFTVALASSPDTVSPAWINEQDFDYYFYFPDVKDKKLAVEFAIEGAGPIWISAIGAYAHPDVMYREFERGLVVANPSPRPYAFNLEKLFPGKTFRRLKGSSLQDRAANNGAAVRGVLELGPKDALFLIKN